jgi:DNA-directed RNA polymerase specialized sigma subunit
MEEFIEFIDSHDNEIMTEAQFDEAAGEKDACYHKVKSRYKVWPSAYASGALVQCRKKGAKNWGNSKKKSNENVEMDSKLDVNKLLTSLKNSKTTNVDRLVDAIEMRFMHNMTFKEIGEELNVSPSRAAMIVSKALRLLRWHAARSPGS